MAVVSTPTQPRQVLLNLPVNQRLHKLNGIFRLLLLFFSGICLNQTGVWETVYCNSKENDCFCRSQHSTLFIGAI